jgi:hypothetical protein
MKRKEHSDLDHNWNNAFRVMKTNYGLNDEALGIFAINTARRSPGFGTGVSELFGEGELRLVSAVEEQSRLREIALGLKLERSRQRPWRWETSVTSGSWAGLRGGRR